MKSSRPAPDHGLVSIITPTYNSARWIPECIESVLAQTYTNWEMIIIDDASTDDTAEVVERYSDPRIRYHRFEENVGGSMARNAGIRMARGRWIAFLDSDDVWLPEKLRRQTDFMANHGYGFSYTVYSEMDETGNLLGTHVTGPRRITRNGMTAYCWPGCLTVMYDSDKVGLVQAPDIRKRNDYAMWMLISRNHDCHLLPENLAFYRRRRTGSVSNQSYIELVKWNYRLFRVLGHGQTISLLCTANNVVWGLYKKVVYRRHSGK